MLTRDNLLRVVQSASRANAGTDSIVSTPSSGNERLHNRVAFVSWSEYKRRKVLRGKDEVAVQEVKMKYLLICAVVFVMVSPVWALHSFDFSAWDGESGDYFGCAVDMDGTFAIVGASGDDDLGESTGAAYIMQFNGSVWHVVEKLTASDGDGDADYGISVAISGNRAIVGASGDTHDGKRTGAAYIYAYDGSSWHEMQKIIAEDGRIKDWFGCSVGIYGDDAVIGAWANDENGEDAGAAYVFHFTGSQWVQEAKLLSSDGSAHDYFGGSVAISESGIIVGADDEDSNGSSSGAAYIFNSDGNDWVETAKLTPSDGSSGDHFGDSVDISGDVAAIGAPWDDPKGEKSGSAYVFRNSGGVWQEEQKLHASDGRPEDIFYSVSINGNDLLVGAPGDSPNGHNSGSTYYFQFDGTQWNQKQKLVPLNGDAEDSFGDAVAMSGRFALCGAQFHDFSEPDMGAVYIFSSFKCDETGCTIDMPDDFFQPGDTCYCTTTVCNATTETYHDIPLFVVLDIYGNYYFAPDFTDFTYFVVNLTPGLREVTILKEFTWPTGAGALSDIYWYAALTDQQVTTTVGNVAVFKFGWGE